MERGLLATFRGQAAERQHHANTPTSATYLAYSNTPRPQQHTLTVAITPAKVILQHKGHTMQYTANISWNRNNISFDTKTFDRTHTLQFGSGTTIEASSAPEFAGNAALPNPEELFVASISSCFMLTFLYWAAMKKLTIDAYTAEATATLAKNSEGKMAVTEVTLKPNVTFAEGQTADANTLNELFKKAHDNCFISSSVKTNVVIIS